MKFCAIIFAILTCLPCYSAKDTVRKRREINYPEHYLAFGFSDRNNKPSRENIELRYFNEGKTVNDTFTYNGPLKSGSNLVTFTMCVAACNKYVGARLDLGFVPFANRNNQQSLMVFGLIPVHPGILISPVAGYSRLRKQRLLGRLSEDEEVIYFQGNKYDQLSIRSSTVAHSGFAGMGAYFHLGIGYFLYVDFRYHSIFRQTHGIKIRAYDYDQDLISGLFPDRRRRFRIGNEELAIKNRDGFTPDKLYGISRLSLNVQLIIPFSALEGGPGYTFKRFMGAQ